MPDSVCVIVVDDEPGLRSMIADYLGKQGFVVRTAANGRELDDHLARDVPDLLILDVNMPGEDGFAIAHRMRAGSAVPILMLTAADDVVDRVVGLEIGADDYLTKPFDLRELLARIRALLRRAAPPAATVLAKAHEPSTSPVDPGSKVRFGHPISPEGLGLTERQVDVLALIMQGTSNKAICRTLDLAEATVKNHVTSILKALKVTNRTEAVVAVRDMNGSYHRAIA
jgi:DNA-binding response OmpR family regulator